MDQIIINLLKKQGITDLLPILKDEKRIAYGYIKDNFFHFCDANVFELSRDSFGWNDDLLLIHKDVDFYNVIDMSCMADYDKRDYLKYNILSRNFIINKSNEILAFDVDGITQLRDNLYVCSQYLYKIENSIEDASQLFSRSNIIIRNNEVQNNLYIASIGKYHLSRSGNNLVLNDDQNQFLFTCHGNECLDDNSKFQKLISIWVENGRIHLFSELHERDEIESEERDMDIFTTTKWCIVSIDNEKIFFNEFSYELGSWTDTKIKTFFDENRLIINKDEKVQIFAIIDENQLDCVKSFNLSFGYTINETNKNYIIAGYDNWNRLYDMDGNYYGGGNGRYLRSFVESLEGNIYGLFDTYKLIPIIPIRFDDIEYKLYSYDRIISVVRFKSKYNPVVYYSGIYENGDLFYPIAQQVIRWIPKYSSEPIAPDSFFPDENEEGISVPIYNEKSDTIHIDKEERGAILMIHNERFINFEIPKGCVVEYVTDSFLSIKNKENKIALIYEDKMISGFEFDSVRPLLYGRKELVVQIGEYYGLYKEEKLVFPIEFKSIKRRDSLYLINDSLLYSDNYLLLYDAKEVPEGYKFYSYHNHDILVFKCLNEYLFIQLDKGTSLFLKPIKKTTLRYFYSNPIFDDFDLDLLQYIDIILNSATL